MGLLTMRASPHASRSTHLTRAFPLFFESRKRSILLFFRIPDGKPLRTFPGNALGELILSRPATGKLIARPLFFCHSAGSLRLILRCAAHRAEPRRTRRPRGTFHTEAEFSKSMSISVSSTLRSKARPFSSNRWQSAKRMPVLSGASRRMAALPGSVAQKFSSTPSAAA